MNLDPNHRHVLHRPTSRPTDFLLAQNKSQTTNDINETHRTGRDQAANGSRREVVGGLTTPHFVLVAPDTTMHPTKGQGCGKPFLTEAPFHGSCGKGLLTRKDLENFKEVVGNERSPNHPDAALIFAHVKTKLHRDLAKENAEHYVEFVRQLKAPTQNSTCAFGKEDLRGLIAELEEWALKYSSTIFFADAQTIEKNNPGTVEPPTESEMRQVRVGWVVKVCACKERFWVLIDGIQWPRFTGQVDNVLVATSNHGLVCGDHVEFTWTQAYDAQDPRKMRGQACLLNIRMVDASATSRQGTS